MQKQMKVAVVGGGIAGSIVALRLAEMGLNAVIYEEGKMVVNGPPMCHLHAGGNFYREISDEQCIKLLIQSIQFLRVFRHCIDRRPTIVLVPRRDSGDPLKLVPRLKLLQHTYRALVEKDVRNKVLGDPESYYRLYEFEDVQRLSKCSVSGVQAEDDWMITAAKNLKLNLFKFPFVLVKEFGVCMFKVAAQVELALQNLPQCEIRNRCKVVNGVLDNDNQNWALMLQQFNEGENDTSMCEEKADYLVNACGYQSGKLDDVLDAPRTRLVEFKAAYVAHWPDCKERWPEVIIHGLRGTPNGMAQLTPLPNNHFLIHGMTKEITLFEGGLVSSSSQSSQPRLADEFNNMLSGNWDEEVVRMRTLKAIEHVAHFVPAFRSATVGGIPLWGAQQIPGAEASLRATDVSFYGSRYARAEIVKAPSAFVAAEEIANNLCNLFVAEGGGPWPHAKEAVIEFIFKVTCQFSEVEIMQQAKLIAEGRNRLPLVSLALPQDNKLDNVTCPLETGLVVV